MVILQHLVISVNNNDLKLVFYIWKETIEITGFGYIMQILFLDVKKTKSAFNLN